MEKTEAPSGRIQLIDAMRGASVILMILRHFALDLTMYAGAPEAVFYNPVSLVVHYLSAGTFILLAGVSSRFSRSNVKRGVKCFLIGMGLTVVTSLPVINEPIRFGILHFMGFAMVFYGLTHKAWEAVPKKIMPFLCILLLIGSKCLVEYVPVSPAAAKFIFPFGWLYPGFYSADFFPVFPWLFLFLLGTWAGGIVRERKLPEWFYTCRVKILPQIGRKSLTIYVLHQPILIGLIFAYQFIAGKI